LALLSKALLSRFLRFELSSFTLSIAMLVVLLSGRFKRA
jgi:hypothetical protein